MIRARTSTLSVLGAALLIAASALYAQTNSSGPTPPTAHVSQRATPDNQLFLAERQRIINELKNSPQTATTSAEPWTAKHHLYVGCPDTPPGATYSTIQEAVAAAYPYTRIDVCPGSYEAGGAGTGIQISTAFIEIHGVSAHEGAATLECDSQALPNDGSYGVYLTSSHIKIKNITFSNCAYGALVGGSNDLSKDNEISNSWFMGNFIAVAAEYSDHLTVSDNGFEDNYYAINTAYDFNDALSGNCIKGDSTGSDVGILLEYGVGAKVIDNKVTSGAYGLELYNNNDLAAVKGNRFNKNFNGIYIYVNNSGNTFEDNHTDDNSLFGILTEDTEEGVAATPDAGANRFINNHSTGNGHYDYCDETYGYSGGAPGTNDSTADFYRGNKGTLAYPAIIVDTI